MLESNAHFKKNKSVRNSLYIAKQFMNTRTVVGIIDVYIIPSFLYIGRIHHEADTHNGDVKQWMNKVRNSFIYNSSTLCKFGQQHYFVSLTNSLILVFNFLFSQVAGPSTPLNNLGSPASPFIWTNWHGNYTTFKSNTVTVAPRGFGPKCQKLRDCSFARNDRRHEVLFAERNLSAVGARKCSHLKIVPHTMGCVF